MKVLFISRKNPNDIGGLSRFTTELTSHFPYPYHLLSLTSLTTLITLTFPISHIHLLDTTILPLGVLLKLILRKPLTLTAHGKDLTFPNPIYQMMLKILLPQVSAVILDSQAAIPLMIRFKFPLKKIFVINPGISISHLKSLNTPNSPYLPNLKGKLVLLTVGNLVLRKGHVWFLKKVFRKLTAGHPERPKAFGSEAQARRGVEGSPKFVYLIVGEGPEKENIKHTIRSLHLDSRVFLLGRISHPQLAHLYQTAHIYICPNQTIAGDFEGFCLAAGEAAALGLPVVASKVDGIPEIIKDGKNGILVEPTSQAFIETINRLKSPIIRKKLGQKAKVYTKRYYNWQQTVQKYLEVFNSVIARKERSQV